MGTIVQLFHHTLETFPWNFPRTIPRTIPWTIPWTITQTFPQTIPQTVPWIFPVFSCHITSEHIDVDGNHVTQIHNCVNNVSRTWYKKPTSHVQSMQ